MWYGVQANRTMKELVGIRIGEENVEEGEKRES